jgi:hypothetical protein
MLPGRAVTTLAAKRSVIPLLPQAIFIMVTVNANRRAGILDGQTYPLLYILLIIPFVETKISQERRGGYHPGPHQNDQDDSQ